MDKTQHKDPPDIYVPNWIYLRYKRTLSLENFKNIQRLTS